MNDHFKTTLEENENYQIILELTSGCPFLHCRVKKFNISVYKQIKLTLSQLLFELKKLDLDTIFAVIAKQNVISLRLVKSFGFVEESDHDDFILMGLS